MSAQFVDSTTHSVGHEDYPVVVPILRCECLAAIGMDDLRRGYCSGCMRMLSVEVGAAHFGVGNG